MDYYKQKLIEKYNSYFESKGFKKDIVVDCSFDNMVDSYYQVISKETIDEFKIIKLIKLEYIRTESGYYIVRLNNQKKSLKLKSITFEDGKENREFKLNNILNDEINPYICKNSNKKEMSKADKKKQHLKEMKSFKNKITGSNLVWFESLSEKKKWDLLFEWKSEKYNNKLDKPKVRFVKRMGRKVKVINYPVSFKHFLKSRKRAWRYRARTNELRNSAIDLLLNQ